MTGVLLGAASFILVFWVDLVSLRGIRVLKPVLWAASIALFFSGLVLCILSAGRLELPAPVRVAGWVLGIPSAALLVYSLFLEIPFVSVYVQKGKPSRLVTSGTYALCRHPGVLWLLVFLAGVFLATGSPWLLAALPAWVGLDVLYVVLQEKLFFIPLFGSDYKEYQRRVPMLIPTARSSRECARTIFRRKRG